ncbi:MAG: DNA primase [Microcystis sp.]|jgi:DNA primase|uniref:DNA primase n=4 Tax=Microcystis TaxID=1125 RepID=I4IP60_MICAE|nr:MULTISPECIES: DNA primase [Microcystis]MCA2819076.1 DNA primase [Microcystis sp. M085S1]MCA2856762.1 DNA primase [Microcystis sp. M065S1]TRT81181.1 MAG: DNA primase [Microcystis flos-aquae Ma_QC_C_20070823_S18]TRU00154.1 MAG: DNA primase [Microcystis flos-aquae Ma_QC_C_20070823_S18D]TRV14184.1 MAG: DNA primase [Microcystis flos-aquae Mf_QC_C_20070823_S10D]TRV29018.1 MAG: DNA primase [Microcystis flos-aquae Mf_QC_C_20070823_S10]TRV30974.1 MAG: DNA primase [Microcystis flos-aquae Mf_QC_C_20
MDTPRLHPDTIEEVKQRIDIVDLISERVVLKKRGREYVGLCPFHEEKSPSFTVSPAKQMYYCFGCGAGGNGIKFFMEVGKQSFSEVVFDLARRYQIPIKTLAVEQRQELEQKLSLKEQLYEIMAVAVSFYQHALSQPQGEKALDYLKVQRQLTPETIANFQLGYSPQGWETLYRYLVEQKRYPVALVEQAGLIKARQNGSGYYDQFRDRLMIPIFDSQGRAIAFGSRTLGNEQPKYLNSPDTPLFEKGKTLFALDRAKQAIIQQDLAIVVEGYFDAIALHAASINNVVACLGTALSQEQIKLLLRYSESKQIIFNFDADQAGIKATQRAIEEINSLVYSGQVNLKILNLPEGKDADEFLKSHTDGVNSYRELIENSPFWIDWQISQMLVNKDLKQGLHFQQVSSSMVSLLQKLIDGNQRTFYLDYCAEILAQKDATRLPYIFKNLSKQVNKPLGKSPAIKRKNILDKSEKNGSEKAEWLLLLIYLHSPEYRRLICELLDEKDLIFNLPDYRWLWQVILELETQITNQRDLMSALQNHLLIITADKNRDFNSLFHLNEHTSQQILQPEEQIKNAIIALEKISLMEYRRYCQEQLINALDSNQREFYQQEFYQTVNKLIAIDPHYQQA